MGNRLSISDVSPDKWAKTFLSSSKQGQQTVQFTSSSLEARGGGRNRVRHQILLFEAKWAKLAFCVWFAEWLWIFFLVGCVCFGHVLWGAGSAVSWVIAGWLLPVFDKSCNKEVESGPAGYKKRLPEGPGSMWTGAANKAVCKWFRSQFANPLFEGEPLRLALSLTKE